MKILVASDIHGSLENTIILLEKFKMHSPDKLILLGDVYNAYSYSVSRKMGDIFSEYCHKLVILAGNWESDDDLDISPVVFYKEYMMMLGNRNIYFNHGHRGFPNVTFNPGDIYCHGHTHISKIEKYNDIIICNPGSVSLPRGGTPASYMIIDETGIYIYDFRDNIVKKLLFEV